MNFLLNPVVLWFENIKNNGFVNTTAISKYTLMTYSYFYDSTFKNTQEFKNIYKY